MATPSLLMTLVPNAKLPKKALAYGRLDFMGAMKKLNKVSVFDIIRTSKNTFIEQVALYSDADAATAYDSAMCYAIQIVRASREQQISSGRKQVLTRRSGIRALIEVGPSYPNLFTENWDDFCKPGAIEAKDSPPAYLCSLYRYARNEIEGDLPESKLLIDKRRPDLKGLVIDQQSTFTPIPMLNIVNQVLSKGIEAHHQGDEGDSKNVYERLMEKHYPFIFPYNFYHHQVHLGLSDKKPSPGELYNRVNPALPTGQRPESPLALTQSNNTSLTLLSGLSPQQIELLTAQTLFSDFYICTGQIKADKNNTWRSPDSTSIIFGRDIRFGYVLPNQETTIASTDPGAMLVVSSTLGVTKVDLHLVALTEDPIIRRFTMTAIQDHYEDARIINSNSGGGTFTKSLTLYYDPADNKDEPLPSGYSAQFYTLASSLTSLDDSLSPQRSFLKRTFTLLLDNDMGSDFVLSDAQNAFFESHYGARMSTAGQNPLRQLDTFMAHTELTTDQVESLLAQRRHAPVLSANFFSTNPLCAGNAVITPFPYASHYGACYVNGVGANEPGIIGYKSADNSLGLLKQQVFDNQDKPITKWVITNTSLNRFDRLQRMIRLQRWINIPFNELDTLIVAAIRSEGESNLGMELNANTLRTLGAWRYFNAHYGIKPQEFAAFLHYLTPFTTGDKKSLFDHVFNSPVLFDSPLVLDHQLFNVAADDAVGQKTISQLAAGLKLQPGEVLRLLSEQVNVHVGENRRSLVIVSSLYRQARMAQMLGLTVEDALVLVELLGGERYKKCWATGELSERDEVTTQVPDILDVLMELEWLVRWLDESKQTPKGLLKMLGLDDTPPAAPQSLVDRVNQLVNDANKSVVTGEQVTQLNLPDGPKWLEELGKTLLDSHGLLKPLPISLLDEVPAQLQHLVTAMITPLSIDKDLEQEVINKLSSFLIGVHDRQLRLIEGFLQETTQLPMNLATVLTQWAGSSIYELLSQVVPKPPGFSFTLADFPETLANLLFTLFRHADVVKQLNLSESALRMFLMYPKWLGGKDSISLSLPTLFLLERYSALLETSGNTEDSVLNYFIQANLIGAGATSNVQRNITGAYKAALIANVLGWKSDEINHLLDYQPSTVTTLAELEWLQRVKQNCDVTRLSARAVVQLLNLQADSPTAQWNALGEAVMSAAQTSSNSLTQAGE